MKDFQTLIMKEERRVLINCQREHSCLMNWKVSAWVWMQAQVKKNIEKIKPILWFVKPPIGDSSWNLIASFCGAACTVWHSFVKAHWGVHSILQIRFWFVYFHSRLLHSWKAMQSRKYGVSIIMIYFIRHEVNQKLGRAYCPGLSIFSVFMLM